MNERFMFRGKSKSSGQWVSGFLVENYIFEKFPEIRLDKNYWEESFGSPPGEENFHLEGGVEVIPETIGQCTGQNAMSGGGLVFEGDLVDVYNPMADSWGRCVVKWENDASGYVCLYVDQSTVELDGCQLSASGTYFDGGYCRIVGNIHDQKEASK